MVLHELITTDIPFHDDDEEQFMRNIMNQELDLEKSMDQETWRTISENAKSILVSLLDKNPETRISAEEALKHPWFDDLEV